MSPTPQSPRRRRLSAVMLLRDEEPLLADTLASLRTVADELLVLDTGSTDRTAQVAEQHAARVVRIGWQHDFAAARNIGLRLATGQWILWLDAGERLEGESGLRLRRFVDQEADPGKAYLLLIRLPRPSPGASAEQAARVRLMPKDPRIRFEGRVRETVRPSLEAAGIGLELIDAVILAHARHHDAAGKTVRAYRHLELARLEATGRADCPPRVWLAWGDAYQELGLFDRAGDCFRRAIDAAPPGSTEKLAGYYGLISAFDGDPFLREHAFSACLEALAAFPLDAQLLLAAGHYLETQGQLELAARAFRSAWQFGQVDMETWHLEDLHETAAACLGLALRALGREQEAERTFQEALGRYPDSVRLLRRLLEQYVHQGRCEAALELVQRLPMDESQRGALADAVRGACKAAEHDWTAAVGYLQGALVAGCRDPLCLRWLAVSLISNGRLREAEPVLRQWEAAEPDNVEAKRYLALLSGESTPHSDGDTCAGKVPSKGTGQAEPLFRLDPASTLVVSPPRFPVFQRLCWSFADVPWGWAKGGAPEL